MKNKNIVLAMTFCLCTVVFIGKTKAQTYNPADVAVIKALIANNSLAADSNDPSSWDFATWDTSSPKQLIELDFYTSEHFEMTGNAFFVGLNHLTVLVCIRNNLTQLDASGLTNLENLICDSNKLTLLNVSGCTNLEFLECPQNNLMQLDVSGLTNLWGVLCVENELTLLNVSGTNLIYLFCQNNNLTQLDVSDCINLEYFDCSYNNLTQLNVSGFTNLASGLVCEGNNLTQLNLSGCTNLGFLSCNDNNLTQLDVSDCISLEWLDCSDNKLTQLDISILTILGGLYCNGNNLTALDLTGLTNLRILECSGNNLTELDVSDCTDLQEIDCSGNNLTQLNLSDCISLRELDCSDNKLTTLDLTDMFMLNWITGDNQSVELTLNKNGNGTYSVPIELNTPIFSNSVIQYNGGQIISSDKTVLSTNFDVQTGKSGCELSGIMSFTYSEVQGIVETGRAPSLRVYPNPTNGELRIINYELREDAVVEIYDVVGRNVGTWRAASLQEEIIIDISHLSAGMYYLKIDGKTVKVIKN